MKGITPLNPDGDFGEKTYAMVIKFQTARFLEDIDGIVGTDTANEIADCISEEWILGQVFEFNGKWIYGGFHPSFGWMPDNAGKCSSFGGPDDLGDRMYGQAYIDEAKSPSALAAKHPKLLAMGILRSDIVNIDKYPIVRDCPPSTKMVSAGASWCLDPMSFYCAIRTPKGSPALKARNENSPRIYVFNPRSNIGVITLRTDYGPHPRTGRNIDLSPGAEKKLCATTDTFTRFCWAADQEELG